MNTLKQFGWKAVLLIVMAGTVLPTTMQAVYDPARFTDPSRRWAVGLSVRGGYDDNVYTEEGDKKESWAGIIEPGLYLNFPFDQTFFGLRYNYRMTYYDERGSDDIDQSHLVDMLFSHRFNPRLVLDINDSFRRGLQPDLVEDVNGVPVLRRNNSDYWYNSLSAGLTYNFSRRWIMSLRQGWEWWDYDQPDVSFSNDRDTLRTTASGTYAISPVTSVGMSYQFSTTLYKDSGVDDIRDSSFHTVYGSLTHQFTPQLGFQANAGVTAADVRGANDDLTPYLSTSLSYTYMPRCTLSGGVSYYLTSTDVSSYRTTDSMTLFGRVSHQITAKLRGTLNGSYVFNNYSNPNPSLMPVPTGEPEENIYRIGVGLSYQFTRWLSSSMSYTFDEVSSDFSGRDYQRNRVDFGVRVSY